jgi:hypothetical protein
MPQPNESLRRAHRLPAQSMRGGAVAQLRAQDCAWPQNHCRVPLFRQAPPQYLRGASTGSTRDAV